MVLNLASAPEEILGKADNAAPRNDREKSPVEVWAENEIAIAKKNTDWYMNAAIDSAMRAFRCLCEDKHSGLSIQIAQEILNRLIDQLPLTELKDTDEFPIAYKDANATIYQASRCSAVMKTIRAPANASSGKWIDVGAQIFWIDVGDKIYNEDQNCIVEAVHHETDPIVFPYFPDSNPIQYLVDTVMEGSNVIAVHVIRRIRAFGRISEPVDKYYRYVEDTSRIEEFDKEEFEVMKKGG